MIKQLVFMRVNRLRERGQICTTPFPQGYDIGTDNSFIRVNIDLTMFDESTIADPSTITLILPPLIKKYPNTTESYQDEDGNSQERTIFGYFDELGSNSGETPMITLNDLNWGGK